MQPQATRTGAERHTTGAGLATEAQLLRTLKDGTYTVADLYALCEARADVARAHGNHSLDERHGTDTVSRRRVRGALQTLKASGRAHRVGRACWAIEGQRRRPSVMILLLAGGEPGQIALRVKDAKHLLQELEEPVDLVVCDPPYGLGRDAQNHAGRRLYARDHSKVIDGYVDVESEDYSEWTFEWVAAAATVLRSGGQLVAVTGPQRAAIVQTAAEAHGLNWVATIAARREFALRTTRKPACAHWAITVMCRGAVCSADRVFTAPDDLPRSNAGNDYPLDVWLENGRADRPGLLRYDNSLPPRMVRRIVRSFCERGMLVVDPCLGGGETAIQCYTTGRRFIGGDINERAVTYTAARLLAEHAWPGEAQPSLIPQLS